MAESADRPVLSLNFTYQVRQPYWSPRHRGDFAGLGPHSGAFTRFAVGLQIGLRTALNVVDATDTAKLTGP
jgi:hypothetical protein